MTRLEPHHFRRGGRTRASSATSALRSLIRSPRRPKLPRTAGEELADHHHGADQGIDGAGAGVSGRRGKAKPYYDEHYLDELLAVFDVTVDVLQHDDDIIDDNPMASTSAGRRWRLIVEPSIYMMTKAPIVDTETVTADGLAGHRVDRGR